MPTKVSKHEFLEIYSKRIYKIAIPVILTLIGDVWCTRALEQKFGNLQLDRTFAGTLSTNSGGVPAKIAVFIALGFILAIALVTGLLLLLYWYGCVKCIYVWMIVAVSLLLSYYVYLAVGRLPGIYNIPMDYISVVIFLLNGVVVGGMSIFWRAPPIVTQCFMIWISILTACVFLNLPDWTVWILLVLLIIWDCCVVLCPNGLLHLLIKKSQERGDAIPALVYSSAAFFWEEGDAEGENNDDQQEDEDNVDNEEVDENSADETDEEEDNGDGKKKNDEQGVDLNDFAGLQREPEEPPQPQDQPQDQPQQEQEGEQKKPVKKRPTKKVAAQDPENPDNVGKKKKRSKDSAKATPSSEGIKLGLGDFIFYGILCTRAARVGWDIAILDMLAVMDGLALTLLCLAYFQRPLPALPFSLALGIIFYIIGAYTFRPFATNLRSTLLVF